MVNTTNTDVASQISNKKYTVLTSTWYNGSWINITDTNQRNNIQENLNGVGQQVKQAQVGIKTAINQASDAMSSASVAIESSNVNSQAIVDVNSAVSESKSDAANAFDQAKSAMSNALDNSSAVASLDSSMTASISSANDRINSATSAIDANTKAISANEAANSNAVASLTKTITDNATSANSAIADAKAEIDTNTKSITAVKTVADSAQSASVTATKTASDASVTAVDAKSDAVVATQSATKAQTTAVNAQSDATTAIQTASEASLTATDANSNAVLATQTATKAQTTATNLTSDVTVATQTASEASVTATNASKDATTALTTASGASVTASKANSLATTASVTATGAQTTAVNAQSDATTAIQTATKAQTTATNASKDATTALTTASGASVTATNAKSDVAVVATTASETSVSLKTAQGDITSLKASASQTSLDIASNSSAVASVTATAKGLQTTVANNSSAISGLKTTASSQATQLSQTASQVALKADQTAVDTLKGTVTANSAAISVQADEIKQKVTSSDVQGLLNNGGYATQTWTSGQLELAANKFSLNLSALQTQVDNSAVGTNLLTSTDKDISITSYTTDGLPAWVNIDTGFSFDHGKTYTFSAEAKNSTDKIVEASIRVFESSTNTQVGIYAFPADGKRHSVTFTIPNDSCDYHLLFYAGHAGIIPGVDVTTTYHHPKLEKGSLATDWCPNPADNATVTSVTNLEATVDGLQTSVQDKVDQSKFTQLSNVVQSKVSQSDFNQLNSQVNVQTLDNANIDNMKTTGHYFVHSLNGNPIGGWVYVDVTGDDNVRIRQDVYQDIGTKHSFRRWVGTYWTDWSTGAEESEITQLRDDINLRVKSGDLLSQINIEAGQTLIQSNKIYFDADSFVLGPQAKAFIPSAYITSLSADKISGGTIDGKLISANALNVALDNWSSNLQLAPNGLTIINGGITALQMDYSGLALFDPTTNTSVGKIHGAAYDNAKNPGLAFDLDTHGDFMAWTVQDDASEGYHSKLLWTREDLASELNIQQGFHVNDNITFQGNIYPEDATNSDASHVHFQDITVNGARGFGIVNDLGCGIVICDNKTVWAVKQTNGTATQILG